MADAKVEIQISAKDTASAVFNKVGKSAADLGKTLAVAVAAGGAAVAAGLGVAVKAAADFDKQMSAIAAAGGKDAAVRMGELSGLALQLGKDTSKSASEAAAGIEELIKAGIPIDAVLNGAAMAATNLSEATGTDMATAASVAAAAMNTFGKTGEDMAAVTDTVTGAVNASSLSVEGFALGIAAAGTSVAAAGGNFEDTATALAAMSRAGLSGSDAGTSLKNMYNRLVPSTKEATTAMKELGLITANGKNQFFDATGSVKSYGEIAGLLEQQLGHLTNEQRLNTLATIFGVDAQRAALIAMELGADGVAQLGEQVNRQGQAAEAAAARMDNLAGDVEKLGGSAETAAIALGQAFQQPLREATQAFTAFLNDAVIPFITEHGPKLAELASTAARGLAGGAGNFVDAAKKIASEGLDFLGTKLAEAGPAWAEWAEKSGDAGKAVDKALQGASGAVLAFRFLVDGNLPAAANTAKQSFKDFGEAADGAKKSVAELRLEIEKLPTTKVILDNFAISGESLGNAFKNFGDVFGGLVTNLLSAAGAGKEAGAQFDILSGIARVITLPFVLWSKILEIISNYLKFWGDRLNEVIPLVTAIGTAVGQTAEQVGTHMESIRKALVDGFLKAVADANTALTELEAGVRAGLSGAAAAVGEFIGNLFDQLGTFASTAFAQATAIGTSIVSGVVSGITAKAGEVASAAARMVTNALQAARDAIGAQSPSTEFAELGEDAVEGLVEGIEEHIPDAEMVAAALGRAAADAVAESIEAAGPEAHAAGIDLGALVADGLAAGLAKVKLLAGAVDPLKGTVAGAMRDISGEIDRLKGDLDRKLGDVATRAARAMQDAAASAAASIQQTIAQTAQRIADMQTSLIEGRATRAAREAITGRHDDERRARDRRRTDEDMQRERSREDKDFERQLQEDIEAAKTDEERAGIIARASEERDAMLKRRKEEDEDLAYRRRREDEDREFAKQQERELRAFEDALEDEALRKSIQRTEHERDERIRAITEALAEKQKKIEEDAAEEQRKLIEATDERIRTLKDDFIAQLPPLTAEASSIVERFLAGIDAGLQQTLGAAHAVADAIRNIPSAPSAPSEPGDGGEPPAAPPPPVAGGGRGGVVFMEHGGVVPGPLGEPRWAVVHGGETVLPGDYVRPQTAHVPVGGATTINITVLGSVATENDLVDAVHSGLLRKQQRNASLGLS